MVYCWVENSAATMVVKWVDKWVYCSVEKMDDYSAENLVALSVYH